MSFLTNADIRFAEKELVWGKIQYTFAEAMPTTKSDR